jgi:ribosomal-protein-alanine N-acetyltransferase
MVMERTEPRDPVRRPVLVEPMHRRHLKDVVRIEEATNPRPWSRRLFASELRQPDSRIYLVARVGQEIVGYAGLMLVAGDGHVTNVGVAEAHRRQGVATHLVLELVRRAVAEGAEALTLEVRASNLAAQGLYRRFGFAPAGVRARYYPPADGSDVADHEDALVMWASDIDSPGYRSRLFDIDAGLVHPDDLEEPDT